MKTSHYTPATLAELIKHSCEAYASNTAVSFVNGSNAYTYRELGQSVQKTSELMSFNGIGSADKVIILSENMPNWAVAFFATTAYGRVVVPVLPDCSANEVNNIVKHSEARAAFVSTKQMQKLNDESKAQLELIVDLNSLQPVKVSRQAANADVSVPAPEDLAAILYTSGTSGNAKGVMLSHRNLCHNLLIAPEVHNAVPEDIWLSFLPMAHTYELSLALLFPINSGSRVYYLEKAPTPSVIINAIKQVKPTLICSVPLIIEKIYRKSVMPKVKSSAVLRTLFKLTPKLAHVIVGKRLLKTFGGKLKVFAIGGAKLDREVEAFLHKAGFPYAIGYGLTETAPLICAAPVGRTKVGTTGWVLSGEQLRLEDKDPNTGIGELCVTGPNVMMGYYKDPERTAETFTKDGWFRTKDLATIDADGRVSIVGRIGNMIVGASGENIYPEEIEMVVNNLDGVEESIVKSEHGRLVALVKMNDEILNARGLDALQADEQLQADMLKSINSQVNKASQLCAISFVAEAFEKTATRKIRRFKY